MVAYIVSDTLRFDLSLSVGLCPPPPSWGQLRVGCMRPTSKSGSRLARSQQLDLRDKKIQEEDPTPGLDQGGGAF